MARTRQPTEEERELFRAIFKDATPLAKARKRSAAGAAPAAKKVPPSAPVIPAVKTMPRVSKDVPPIGGHREAQLRRGRLEPEARLDLHGLTQGEAHRALQRFFGRARGEDQRLVLVITGKGGVLKSLVPRWLAEADFRPLVAGLRTAHIRHGGEGAFYVALRKMTPRGRAK